MDNGGYTLTCTLLPGSPVIDAGSCINEVYEAQRGVMRPQGIGCDIGAFEYQDIYPRVFLSLIIK